MKIAIINTTRKKYGGNAYEKMIKEVLSDKFDVEFISAGVKGKSFLRYLEFPLVFLRIYKTKNLKDFNVAIRNYESSIFLTKKPTKNIALIHHIDSSTRSFLMKFVYGLIKKKVLKNLKKFNQVVVVSQYWKEYLNKKGIQNIAIIYNAFNLNDFQFDDKELEEFKKKYNLTKKPIIYIGNCRKDKGVVESYNILKELNVYLVTSGKQQVKIPAINLEIGYKDYLKLLKVSSVAVIMSKFKEGWNRTTHEAMLCKTPVIGSGLGGMEELLKGGKQIICRNFDSLKENVEYLLNNPWERQKIGENGYNFAKQFTIEKFKDDWLNLIRKLT